MVARGHGVDRVGADQFLDIKHIAVILVIRPCTRPEQPLDPCAFDTQLFPTRTREALFVALISELGVCDCHFAA